MITEEEFQDLKERVEKLEKVVFAKEEFKPKEKIAFATFVQQKNPKNHEERAATIGYYLWKYENKNFTNDDISSYCKKVSWPTYSNPTMLIRRLKSKGWIEEIEKNSEGKIEYRILIDGIKQVENNFNQKLSVIK
jgi:hypothetical protein